MGKRLAEYNCRKREELKVQKSEVKLMLDSSMCYSTGAVLAVGMIGGLGYYAYQAKVNAIVTSSPQQLPKQPSPQQPPKANKFEME